MTLLTSIELLIAEIKVFIIDEFGKFKTVIELNWTE